MQEQLIEEARAHGQNKEDACRTALLVVVHDAKARLSKDEIAKRFLERNSGLLREFRVNKTEKDVRVDIARYLADGLLHTVPIETSRFFGLWPGSPERRKTQTVILTPVGEKVIEGFINNTI